jgi:hypothetical protein
LTSFLLTCDVRWVACMLSRSTYRLQTMVLVYDLSRAQFNQPRHHLSILVKRRLLLVAESLVSLVDLFILSIWSVCPLSVIKVLLATCSEPAKVALLSRRISSAVLFWHSFPVLISDVLVDDISLERCLLSETILALFCSGMTHARLDREMVASFFRVSSLCKNLDRAVELMNATLAYENKHTR